jgi:hypothetical protein
MCADYPRGVAVNPRQRKADISRVSRRSRQLVLEFCAVLSFAAAWLPVVAATALGLKEFTESRARGQGGIT